MNLRRPLGRFLPCFFFLFPGAAFAAAPDAAAPDAAPPPARETLTERSVYVPFNKLWSVFEKEGRGVFVPYEDFQRLWNAAELATRLPAAAAAPASFLAASFDASAAVAEDVVEVRAVLRVELLARGWHRIPLRLGDTALRSAAIGAAPARIASTPDEGYVLMLEHKSDKPASIEVALDFAKSFEKAPGRNEVSFETPPTPISRWEFRIPGDALKVEVQPMLASTDIAPAAGGGTRILAFMGATPRVRFLWTPKTEGAKGLQALINARVEQETRIEEGRSFTRARIAFDVSRTEIKEFEIEAPADQKVVNVFDENVREWSVRETGGVQRVTATLFEPVRGTQHIAIEMERFGDAETISVPLVRCPGAGRQEGAIVVRAGAGLRLEMLSREGVRQVDREELPAALAQGAWDFAGRYTALPYDVRFRVEKIQPRIMAETFVTTRILPEETLVHGVLTYDVQRAGVFRLSLRVPTGYDVREVVGVAAGDARAAAVEGWKLEEAAAADAPDRVLRVNLLEKALGRVALSVSLRRAGGDPALLAPLGRAATIPIVFPRAEPTEVERETGRLVVYAPASLRLTPGAVAGLREMPVAEALQGRTAPGLGVGEQPLLAYAFERGEASLSVAAERRAPHVTARQLLVVHVEPGVVRYRATFHYGILYSAVKTLRIGVPRDLAGAVRLVTPGLRYTPLAETPEDVEAGRVVWEIAGEGEFADGASSRLEWEHKIEGLDVGASVVIPVPRLEALAVDRAWGQIALAKAETIDLAPTDGVEGLEPIDPRRDLAAGAGVENAARAFEFRGPWKLGVLATRYEIKEVKTTSIERALVRAVVTRGDVTSVQALYRMRSARQRLDVRLPGDIGFDTQPVRIDGRPVSLEQGAAGEYFVPLTAARADEPFVLEIRYTVRGGGLRIAVPEFPKEPAVQKVYLSVYIPSEWSYLGFAGPWDDEMVWVLKGCTTWPRAAKNADWLVNWVCEGVATMDRQTAAGFATDGRNLLYAALRPAPAPDGDLRVRVLHAHLLQGLLMSAILLAGLLLLPASGTARAVAAGAAAILAIVMGIFLPSAARAVVNNGTVGAGFVVLVVWALWHLVVVRPRDPLVAARRQAREQARAQRRQRPPAPPVGEEGSRHA